MYLRFVYVDENIQALKEFVLKKSNDSEIEIQLKFVVGIDQDVVDIKDLISDIGDVSNDDIVIMPLGANSNQLLLTSSKVAGVAVQNRWRFSPRIHIDLFNDIAGV